MVRAGVQAWEDSGVAPLACDRDRNHPRRASESSVLAHVPRRMHAFLALPSTTWHAVLEICGPLFFLS
jgi:hypothetical protein